MISAKKLIYKLVGSANRIGVVQQFAGSTAPSGWLMCNGQAVSRTEYSQLFSVIGTTYGAGDGSGTFNVPDMRGRVGVGASPSYALGSTGGEATHTLTINEMPSHNHINKDRPIRAYVDASHSDGSVSVANSRWYTENLSTMLKSQGGGQAHNNMQPYVALNYIIYAGK